MAQFSDMGDGHASANLKVTIAGIEMKHKPSGQVPAPRGRSVFPVEIMGALVEHSLCKWPGNGAATTAPAGLHTSVGFLQKLDHLSGYVLS